MEKERKQRKKRTTGIIRSLILAFVLLFGFGSGAGTGGKTAYAAVEPWMATAGTIQLNSGMTGTASNNVAPTLMSPWWSYARYYYFYVPTTMKVTLDVTVSGTKPFAGVYLLDSNGKRMKELWPGDWTYSRNTNSSRMTYSTYLRAGSYYIKQWDIYEDYESVRFSTMVYAELSGSPTVSKLQKTSRTSAKLTWRKMSEVDGYEIYRSTSKNGNYKKIKTVSAGKKSFKNSGLKTKKAYYYKVRAYKRINGRMFYSSFSPKKRVKM